MKLAVAYRGERKTIFWLVLDGEECPARDFLEELEKRDRNSHRAMVRRQNSHGDIGFTRIRKHGHPIRNRKNLYVWKTDQGSRLLYFYLTENSVVVTIGYNKGAPEKQQYDRAEKLRDDWLRQRGGLP